MKGILYIPYREGWLTGLFTSLRRNCLLKYVIEGTIEGRTEGVGRRREELQDDLKEMTACCKLEEEALIAVYGELAFGRGTLRNG